MNIIRLKEANCVNCYKCIRECPVKSISFSEGQAQIISDECVLCGHCLFTCPQQAKEIVGEVGRVQEFIRAGAPVYVSLAPSFASYFPGVGLAQISAALKKLGVTQVEETALGAAKVSQTYTKLVQKGEMKNIITTACPSLVLLVEKYYPQLTPYLAPVSSPLVAHAKLMRESYGDQIKVVFIGPCIAKKHDVIDPLNQGVVHAALSFEELEQWMAEQGVRFAEEDPELRGIKEPVARFYPIPMGIVKTIPTEKREGYHFVGVDGMDRCMKILDSLQKDGLSGYFLEMNACEGGCVGGPSFKERAYLPGKEQVLKNIEQDYDKAHYPTDESSADISHPYTPIRLRRETPSEADIRRILAKIGKFRPEDELNCGSCGYPSCREKAIAVFAGKAKAEMCLPYVRARAESTSNLIMDYSPNAIIALDERLQIEDANPVASALLGKQKQELLGAQIYEILPCDMYEKVMGQQDKTLVALQEYPQYGIVVEQAVVYVEQSGSILLILKDVTEEQRRRQEKKEMRERTIEITQNVIDKQMRVAQEIASLLGETTAETKVALTRLKRSMGGDSK